jgi:hypothetical protein
MQALSILTRMKKDLDKERARLSSILFSPAGGSQGTRIALGETNAQIEVLRKAILAIEGIESLTPAACRHGRSMQLRCFDCDPNTGKEHRL